MLGPVWLARRLLTSSLTPIARGYASSAALVMQEFGTPEKVLKFTEQSLPSADALGDNEVIISILAAPINPSDINTIEGKYPLHPTLPASPGHEGVGVVHAVGPKVTRLRPGDRCVPIEHSQGTWRTHGVFQDRHWHRIPADIPIGTAANMVINPPTAIRLLEEYVTLEPGDTVIQTGATSSTGKYVIQLAKEKGLKTINIIRDRPNRAQTEHELKELGATVVVTPNELPALMRDTWEYGAPKLALDCVSGDASAAALKTLAPGGTLVVYGSMSQQPITIPPGQLIFRDIKVRGFWLTGGYAKMKDGWKVKEQLVDRVCALFRTKVLKPVDVECVPLSNWEEALKEYRANHKEAKVLLTNFGEDVCM